MGAGVPLIGEPSFRAGLGRHTLIDRRHKTASTIYRTQLPPPNQSHDRMDEKILADAIVDRITINAHATVLRCEDSMRRHFNQID